MRVLSFHGVIERSEQAHHFSFLFTELDVFREQVKLLARRGHPVSLDELNASISNGHRLPDNTVHVSLDDGYRNSLRAAEILDRFRVPWSLFVVVDSVLDGYRPWFLRLGDAIEASTNVMMSNGSVYEMTGPNEKRAFARRAKVEIMAAPHADQDGAVDRLLSLPGMRVCAEEAWPMLGLADLKELRSAGVAIGNHSARHRNLSRCSSADLETEVVVSRRRLEAALGSPVHYFAYPDGRHNRRVRRTVGATHALGLATWTARRPLDRLAVRRYEPTGATDVAAILANPEPWYGVRWARWNLPPRVREVFR